MDAESGGTIVEYFEDASGAFSRHAVWKMARNYTKEAGVRQLEREIGNVCRKAAKESAKLSKISTAGNSPRCRR